jgi:hypothetical protein
VAISNANDFFDRLVGTLSELAARPARPLETAALVGTTKRLLSQRRTRIDLREVLLKEARLLKERLDMFSLSNPTEYRHARDLIIQRARPVTGAITTGCFYGEPGQHGLWIDVFRLVAAQPSPVQGAAWMRGLALRRLPAAMALYAGTLSAWAAHDFSLVHTLLRQPMRHSILEATKGAWDDSRRTWHLHLPKCLRGTPETRPRTWGQRCSQM